jgi:hypothetical protein
MSIAPGFDCLGFDDFLVHPDAARDWAVQRAQQFVQPERSYPGSLLPLDQQQAQPLHAFVRHTLSRAFGFARTGLDLYSQYSLTSLQPEQFSWIQALPHCDPQLAPGRANYAALLYLFRDEALGGTGFYRWRKPEYWARMSAVQRTDPNAGLDELRERFAMFRAPLRYPTGSNEAVELLAMVPARYNRLLCYSGDLPHSACIYDASLLSPDPQYGRLTLNCFASVWPKSRHGNSPQP